jgi:flagellar P-ring protein precursor FlgI
MRPTHGSATIIPGSLVLALCARVAVATAVQDLVRIKGHERNVLTGMGIVVGLNGTGDTSKDSYIAARPYAQLLTNLGNPVTDLEELAKADAYAIVAVTMEIPATGAREGDRLNVSVEKLFNAESLAGGRLVVSLLRPPGPDSPDLLPMAFAEGPLIIEANNPASAIIREGGQMLRDIRTSVVTPSGAMTLVLKDQYAGYPVATTIAGSINDEFAVDGYGDLAAVEDAKNIRIVLPEADRDDPAEFIAMLMTIPIDPSLIRTEARIVINERAGIIAVKGDVEIGPVGITHKGMQLTSITAPGAAGAGGGAAPGRWAPLDTTDGTSRNSTRLIELLAALDQLAVPVEDQIAIIYELKKTGALHAEIVSE